MAGLKKLESLMDWPRIEAVVYAEEDRPHEVLAPRVTEHGVLVQCFFPDEEEVAVIAGTGGRRREMTCVDPAGYFAALLPGRTIPDYRFAVGPEGVEAADPYAYPVEITEKEEKRFGAGIWYRAPERLGAHLCEINGTEGVLFAVYAPNAMRVSVIGAFNGWDGRRHQMTRCAGGIFALFVPGVKEDARYRFELALRGGLVYPKSDPYARAFEPGPDGASIVTAESSYEWKDEAWVTARGGEERADVPLYICQMNLAHWCAAQGIEFSYRAAAEKLAAFLRDKGYTHVEFTPLMEYADDATHGFETSGYFAPTQRGGAPDDLRCLIDHLHSCGIGVIMDFVASYFAGGNSLLADFDGTQLYEHADPRRGIHPAFGAKIFNYGSPQVRSFLASAFLYWAESFHADGFKVTDVATMLFNDYGRAEGAWVANLYGGNENLEAIDFLKELNTVLHERVPGILMIAEEMAGWNGITAPVARDGLGFDRKWNNSWSEEFLSYMKFDPYFRGAHQDELIFSTVYAYSERFVIGFGKDDVTGSREGLLARMSGDEPEIRAANERLARSYMMVHPGKKLRYESGAEEADALDAALAALYFDHPALCRTDDRADGFEWISNLDHARNLLIFLRKTEREEDTLLVICNFSNVEYSEFRIGVPYAGKYKECFNSDDVKFGGSGAVNTRIRQSAQIEHDERKQSIKVLIPPLAISVFRYAPALAARGDNRTAKASRAHSH